MFQLSKNNDFFIRQATVDAVLLQGTIAFRDI